MSPPGLTTTVFSLLVGAFAQTWCNKNYMATEPIVPPGGEFPTPGVSSSPLLAFRCAPSIRPYLAEDAYSPAGFIIDTPVTDVEIDGAVPITLPDTDIGNLSVVIAVDGQVLAQSEVPLNSSKIELPFYLFELHPRPHAFNVTCTATYAVSNKTQTFETSTALSYLPHPPTGRSVTKMDLRTGALLARPANRFNGDYESVLPVGFYTSFSGYLASNLSILNELKAQGFTVVHPIPTFDNLTALELVLDRMEEVGLYLMYDMRWTYQNVTAVTEEVNRVKNRSNLLLWYTADEPDGTSDPLDATSNAYDLIYSLDGYHPVSLVLNCENYEFTAYTAGADIVLQDTYMIGNNVTFSSQWGTPCTTDYGDCGCDNCKGEFEDISTRMDEFAERLWVLGWDRTKAVWTVPQGFGNDTYWKRFPTGKEFVVQSVLGINHGALGVVSWSDPTTDDIKNSASILAKAMPAMKEFITRDDAIFNRVISDRIDVGLWTVGSETLVLATNLNYAEVSLNLKNLPIENVHEVAQVLDSGAKISGDNVTFESVGSGAFILS